MTVDELREKGWIIFEAISGSHAYGLATETSDTDIRGVFVMPTDEVLKSNPTPDGSKNYIPQVNDEKNDIVFYEIGRFIELLERGNPNILELLNVPEDCIVYKSEVFEKYFPEKERFITKKLRHSFVGYAKTQVSKAKGLNKKVHNPQPKDRKELLDFCYVPTGGQTRKVKDMYPDISLFETCGVVKLPTGRGLYSIYFDPEGKHNFRGVLQKKDKGVPNEIRLSSIPKEVAESTVPMLIYFDLDGYQSHCRQHKEYWEWVDKRNPERYKDNMKGNVGYDHKNMMHCLRLIEMSSDIVDKNEIIVRRPNREYLLDIRRGKFTYDELMERVETLVSQIDDKFTNSDLPEEVDLTYSRNLLQTIRLDNFYERTD